MTTITSYRMRSIDHTIPVADTYVARQPGRKTRRVLAAMLKRGSLVPATTTRTEYKRITIDSNRVLQLIIDQGHEVMRRLGRGGETVLIGGQQWLDLTGECNPALIALSIEYGSQNRVLGMTVKVIPWMDGVLVLPSGVV